MAASKRPSLPFDPATLRDNLRVLAFMFIVQTGFAASDFERELKVLQDQHAAALAAATEPINRRQQTALEQLLRRATQANDLNAAVKIKEALAALPGGLRT